MKLSSAIGIAIVIILIILGIIYAVGIDNVENDPRENAIQEDDNRPKETINVKHQYKDGEQVFVGRLDLPTPCHTYNAEIIEGNPFELKITIQSPEEEIACAQVITEKDFKVSYKTAEDTQYFGTLNGNKVNLNVFEIGADQDIDTVELFIKG